MTDLALNAPVNPAPLTGADNLLVQRDGDPAVSRAPANALPVSDATSEAIAAAALTSAQDATTKASAAQAAAISAAASDATSKANAAQAAASSAAASDATTKANAAQAAAATDATTKANAAQAAAIAAAASDATTKANAAAAASVPLTQRGAANGVATLDAGGRVPAGQLPSFVDDVLEFANLGAFPPTGEAGKIYIAINDANTANPTRQYRWSGTAYSEIVASPGTTDDVPEGPSGTRRYFTEERVNVTPITGLLFNVVAQIANGETLRVMLGKIQAQLNNAASVVRGTMLTSINTTVDGEIIETTTVLQAIGRLVARVTARLARRLPDGTDLSFGSVADGQLFGREGALIVGVDAINDVSYTLAERPPAAGNADATIRLKGVGNARSVWQESNGTNWGMQNGRATIIQEAFPASKSLVAMTGSLVGLPDSYTIPGTLLNENSEVRIRARFSSVSPGATNQVQVLINGSPVYESAAGSWFQQTGEVRFSNLGALDAQEFFGPGTTGTGLGNSNSNAYSNPAGSPGSLRAFDTTANLTITFKALGAPGTSIKLSGMTVEVIDR